MIINVSEAKAQLSKLIDMAYQGEEVIISKNNLPLVELVPHKPKEKRKLGL
ncbi:MAG: type II toxin-antitoxin system Phd/YefM family antitoxin, partial [Desulfococcaceae bacterium]